MTDLRAQRAQTHPVADDVLEALSGGNPISEPPSAQEPGLVSVPPQAINQAHLECILESVIFASDRPLVANELAKQLRASRAEVTTALEALEARYHGRGIELAQVAGGYQFRSAVRNAPFVRDFVQQKPVRLSRPQLETLSIIAYRQPVTRPEIDDIRGVDSGSALRLLLERELVKILGKKEDVGRPLLYGTTPYFLEFFGLKALSDLPTLRDFAELNDESRALFDAEIQGMDLHDATVVAAPPVA